MRSDEATAERLISLGTATLHEAAGRSPVIRDVRLLVGPPFAGRAVTVALPAGDNLGIHLALEHAPEGSVLCVASGGGGIYGIVGDLLLASARAHGLAGLLLDDGLRDLASLTGPPSVAARGLAAQGTVKRRLRQQPGGAVSVGGVLILQGDWIVCDPDGTAVIPAARLDAVLAAADAREASEAASRTVLEQGRASRVVFGLSADGPASVA